MKTHGTMGKKLCLLALIALLCLGLSACRKGGDEPETVELREKGARFTVAVAQTPDSFNPFVTEGGLTREFFLLCYDPLWRVNAAGEAVGLVAEDWSLSSDHLTWTVRIRHDAVFSDGVPVTAADVQFSYELMRHSSSVFSEYFDGVTAIRCPDDYTVVISTEYVKGDMLHNPTPILPKHIWQSYEFDPASFENEAMVGSGPFVYDPEGSGDGGWLFRAREEHYGGAARVAEVFFSSYGTVTGAARALAAGEADASFGLSDVQLTTLESVPGVELIQAMLPEGESRMLVFNTRNEFFGQEGMRAMAEYCLDRNWFLSMSSGGAGMVGSSFMTPGCDGFTVPDGLRGYDLNAAAGILRTAGYADVNGDGFLEYGIREVKLRLTLYTSSQDAWASTAATILTSDMEELGVIVDWRKTDKPITEVCGSSDGWDMCLYTWHGGSGAAVTAIRFEDEVGGLTGWSVPEYDDTLALMRSAEDPAIMQGYARQLQQLVYNDCPTVVLAYGADIQAIRSGAWTGYEDLMSGKGLFGVEDNAVYLTVTPREETGD